MYWCAHNEGMWGSGVVDLEDLEEKSIKYSTPTYSV